MMRNWFGDLALNMVRDVGKGNLVTQMLEISL